MRIIFHHPLPLCTNPKSASGIRPLRMLEAFKNIGYKVDLVCGYAKQRKIAIKKIKENISNGVTYSFIYSESSTMPTALTEKHHFPIAPLLDYYFFKFCNENKIPIGLFYRDIYWRFDIYGKNQNFIKNIFAKLAYHFDLLLYKKTLSKMYLPSLKMAEYIPHLVNKTVDFLPPGHKNYNAKKDLKSCFKKGVNLFYVGGISDYYKMHKLFTSVINSKNINLVLCTRKSEWEKVKDEYLPIKDNIKIVHLSGQEMEAELLKSDIALLFMESNEYREFAAPVKLYEYLSYMKPIIATKGTLAGDFVEDHGIGWTIDYNDESLSALLLSIINNNENFAQIYKNINTISSHHTWSARARKVAEDLSL